ncbi:MAG: DUF3891 family protein [Chitinophagaceae bacterium]
MIVNYGEKGWEIITQRAHGIVAAQIGFHWKFSDRPRNWVEIILAIAEHDDAENELDGENLLTDAGGPLNYDMKTFNLEHCRKLASLTVVKSRMIALLTSLHMEFLYAGAKGSKTSAKKFLAEQKKLRSKWMKELRISEAELLKIYNLLECCDALSLLICKGEFQDGQRSIEISTGPDNKTYQLKKVNDQTLTVHPWPFSVPSIDISFESRNMTNIQFSSSAQFRKLFMETAVTEKTWKLARASTKSSKTKALTKVNNK